MSERLDDPQVAAVLARLDDVKHVGDRHWRARCPLNGEHRLLVFKVDGEPLYVACQDGCEAADVLAKIGLNGQDGASLPGTDDLLASIEALIRRYVVVGDVAAVALALFVLHTHAFDAAHATPYLTLLSPERRSGKTLALEVLELLVARPWRVSSTSEAALFRKIARDRPTLLLDEIDAVFTSHTERAEGLRAILNAGNRPGSTVARCVGKGSDQSVEDFEVFGPKVLAGIDTGRLPDTIRDRAIELRMQRKTAAEHVEKFRRRHVEPGAEHLRDQAAAWAVQREASLLVANPEVPDALNDRAADAWEPLLAIADLAGGRVADARAGCGRGARGGRRPRRAGARPAHPGRPARPVRQRRDRHDRPPARPAQPR